MSRHSSLLSLLRTRRYIHRTFQHEYHHRCHGASIRVCGPRTCISSKSKRALLCSRLSASSIPTNRKCRLTGLQLNVLWNGKITTTRSSPVAERPRVLRVIEYFAKSLKSQDHSRSFEMTPLSRSVVTMSLSLVPLLRFSPSNNDVTLKYG